MAEVIKLCNNPHDEVQRLLPWFINGTLNADELRRVEAHLAQCAECRHDLAAERRLAAAIATGAAEPDLAWERIKQRLQTTEKPRLRPIRDFRARPAVLRWLIAAPMAAAAALALFVADLPPRHATDVQYRALGESDNATPANLVIQFRTGTRMADMQAALHAVDARLVGGPTTTGAYLLRVERSRRERALEQLRQDSAVALAQPIDEPPPK